jgi:hypothetical protein
MAPVPKSRAPVVSAPPTVPTDGAKPSSSEMSTVSIEYCALAAA